jgi:hypothetical protein
MKKRAGLDCEQVIAEELKIISGRRNREDGSSRNGPTADLFGIALSGGGIRSATLSLGFLEVFHKFGVLMKADYLSTVSGGGFTGGYVQVKLHEAKNPAKLFDDSDIAHLREYAQYLSPPAGLGHIGKPGDSRRRPNAIQKFMRQVNNLRLAGAFVASLLMNWIWVALVGISVIGVFAAVGRALSLAPTDPYPVNVLMAALVVLGVHYFLHGLRYMRLWDSDVLNYVEGFLLLVVLIPLALQLCSGFTPFDINSDWFLPLSLAALLVAGCFGNPNILTMHRFYRDRLASAFLKAGSPQGGKIRLSDLATNDSSGHPGAPYPLINTCLNLLGGSDRAFSGMKRSDYFLLSPAFVGSEITGYEQTTKEPFYEQMSLATAIAISGAAVNPNMGTKTNRFASFFMSLLNLQLGFWAFHPATRESKRFPITWWPYYHLMQLLCKTDSQRARVNISDGGQIENLGVYELLRRKCRLIVALDGGADPEFEFSDLKNLVIRARNELGISITFRPGHEPEERIKPSPSRAFSFSHFAIADIAELPGKSGRGKVFKGTLVYVKSSVLRSEHWHPLTRQDPLWWSSMYKTNHPSFPHESTADQFFDSDQWEAYYMLGQYTAGDLVDVDLRIPARVDERKAQLLKLNRRELERFFRRLAR